MLGLGEGRWIFTHKLTWADPMTAAGRRRRVVIVAKVFILVSGGVDLG